MNVPQVIGLIGNAVTILALLALVLGPVRRGGWRNWRARRRASRHWDELPRQACTRCCSTHWYTIRRQEEPFRMEERRCDDCGGRFYVHDEWLAHEERQRQGLDA